jgi:hypothetical protein
MVGDKPYLPPVGKSHHNCLLFQLQCYNQMSVSMTQKLLYDMGNCNKMRDEHDVIDWNSELEGKNTEQTWICIKMQILDLVKACIPCKSRG